MLGRNQSEDLVRVKLIRTHVHNLRPFIFNPTQVDPQDIAQQNEQEFVVQEILAHRGNHHELLLVLLRNVLRINLSRVEEFVCL